MNAAGATDGHSVRRNLLSSSIGQIATMVLAVIGTVITARWLGASGRGVLALVSTGATTAAVALLLGSNQAITTFSARGELSYSRAFLVSAGVASFAGVSTALAIAIAPQSAVPNAGLVARYLPLGAAAVSFSVFQVALATGVGRLDLAALNTVVTAASLVVGYLAASSLGIAAIHAPAVACAVWVASQLIGDAVGWSVLRREIRVASSSRVRAGEFIAYSLAAFPAVVVGQLSMRGDILILGLLSSTAEVGVYATSTVAAALLLVAPSAIGASLSRPLGTAVEGRGQLARTGALASIATAFASGPLVVGLLVLFARPLLGSEFDELPLLVALITPGIALFAGAYAAGAFYSTALKRPSLNAIIATTTLVFDVVLLMLLGGRLGAMGAAVASSVSYAIGGVVNLVILWQFTSAEVAHSGSRFEMTALRSLVMKAFRRRLP
jgi:O-antigen/teichoic acid export membrane protein